MSSTVEAIVKNLVVVLVLCVAMAVALHFVTSEGAGTIQAILLVMSVYILGIMIVKIFRSLN